MLSGLIDLKVGLATHYHTDWVRPYWVSSLEKIAGEGTHLFFRWPGFWGTRGAFRGAVSANDAHCEDGGPVAPPMLLPSRRQATLPSAAASMGFGQTGDGRRRRRGARYHLCRSTATRDTEEASLRLRCDCAASAVQVHGLDQPDHEADSDAMNGNTARDLELFYLRDEKSGFERRCGTAANMHATTRGSA